MRSLRKMTLAAMVAVPLSLALVVPASAASHPSVRPDAPFPSCGEHFQLTRHGKDVRIIGTDLYVFSDDYMLVWPAANNESFGSYNASPNSGANFEINTGSTAQTTISISLTNSENTETLCASDYYA